MPTLGVGISSGTLCVLRDAERRWEHSTPSVEREGEITDPHPKPLSPSGKGELAPSPGGEG